MQKLTSIVAATAITLAGNLATADEQATKSLRQPSAVDDTWESDAAMSSSINATYVVVGIFLTLFIVDAVNGSSD